MFAVGREETGGVPEQALSGRVAPVELVHVTVKVTVLHQGGVLAPPQPS